MAGRLRLRVVSVIIAIKLATLRQEGEVSQGEAENVIRLGLTESCLCLPSVVAVLNSDSSSL
jgi:hypothetical protein